MFFPASTSAFVNEPAVNRLWCDVLVVSDRQVVPAPIQAEFKAYVSRCVDATEQARKAINELDDLLETGFRGREVDLVEKMITELDAIEDDTDGLQINIRLALKKLEDELNPIDVMVTYRMIEWIGDLADLAEKVGSRLELMLAR